MNSSPSKCVECGAELPPDLPVGLCPRCALVAAANLSDGHPPGSPNLPVVQPGDRIGRYKFLQQIGEGGCGIVYMAEQEEPIRRKVALKVIKLGMDTKAVIARFEAERQALALMDHPNIAKVLDAGATETGRPYFVMELVRGVRITQYCDQHNLTTRARLDLFSQVCHAIQHAHQKGIIHRDIKPSNILVTLHDGVPVPKVIDFGIAKATNDQQLTEQTLFTAIEQFLGTPAYMSPEQAEMSGLDIDTRSDIYSLGVLLYELLTGRTPFDAKELMAAGFEAMRRTIREKEPVKPSTRLNTMLELDCAQLAQRQQTDPGKLSTILRGDLDWIVMKALDKDRTRRYETATGLAEDIQRYLNQEPVLARPATTLYRVQKLARRNKARFAAASIAILGMVVGLAMSTLSFAREYYARERAVKEAARSRQVAEFLKEILKGVDPSLAGGRDTTVLREILDVAAGRVAKELQACPDVQADLYQTLAQSYNYFEEPRKEEAMHRLALERTKQFYGVQHTNTAAASQRLACRLYDSARQLHDRNQLDEAESLLQSALATYRAFFGDEHPTVAGSFVDLSFVSRWREDWEAAETLLRKAIVIERRFHRGDTEATARYLYTLGNVLEDEGKLAEAERIEREALEINKRLLGETHLETIESLTMVADLVRQRGNLAEAEALQRRGVALRREHFGEFHPRFPWALHLLAEVVEQRGELTEAEALAREALKLAKLRWGEDLPGTDYYRRHLAEVLQKRGQWTEAEALRRDSVAIARNHASEVPGDLGHRIFKLAEILCLQGKLVETEPLFREAEPLLLQATLMLLKSEKPNSGRLRGSFELLMAFYKTWNFAAPRTGKDNQSLMWQQKLSALQ